MYIKIIGDRGRKSVNKCINLCNSDGIPFKLYSPKKQQLTRELLKELLEKSNNGINDFISRNVSVYIRAKINKMSVNQALDYVINNNKIMRTIIIGWYTDKDELIDLSNYSPRLFNENVNWLINIESKY